LCVSDSFGFPDSSSYRIGGWHFREISDEIGGEKKLFLSMGVVAEVWRSSVRLLTNSPQLNGGSHKSALWKWRFFSAQPKRTVMWTWVCGFMLFSLGVISLFTGHVVSHLEWYSQQLSKRSLLVPFSLLSVSFVTSSAQFCNQVVKLDVILQDMSRREPIDVWKSKYSKFFYGCSERGRNFLRKSDLLTCVVLASLNKGL